MTVQASRGVAPTRLRHKQWLDDAYVKHTYPGSTVASLKLNEIGGVLIQQWSMWFNAIIPAKSYQNKKLNFVEIENYSLGNPVLHGRHQFVFYGFEFSYRNERNPLARFEVKT